MAQKKKANERKVEDYRHGDENGRRFLTQDWLPVATLLRRPNRGFFLICKAVITQF